MTKKINLNWAEKLSKSGMLVLIAHILSRGALMLSSILIARNFSPEVFSHYTFFQITITTLATFSAFGLGITASRHFAELAKNTPDFSFPFGTLWLCSLILTISVALLVLTIPSSWNEEGSNISIRMYALGAAIISGNIVPAGAILGLQLYKGLLLTSLVSALTIVITTFLAIYLKSIDMIVLVILLGGLVQLIGDSFFVLRKIGLKTLLETTQLTQSAFLKIFHFTGPMFLVSLINSGGLWFAAYMIKVYYEETNVFVLYVISLQWLSLIMLLPGILTKVSLPILVHSKTDIDNSASNTAVLMSIFLAILGAVFVILFTPIINNIYGGNIEINRWVVFPFVITAIFQAPINILGSKIIVDDRQWLWLLVTIFGTLILITLIWFFRGYGITGSGLGYMFTYLAIAVLTSYLVFKPEKKMA